MTKLRTVLPLALAAGSLVVPGATATAAAKKNPYTATEVCGAGYRVIDRHKLVDSNWGRHLADVVLTYNARTGKNCAVTLKRYRVGLNADRGVSDFLTVTLATRPLNDANVNGDGDNYKYFAGPVYVSARGKCVQWSGSASLLVPANWTPRGYFNSAYKSRWEHCG